MLSPYMCCVYYRGLKYTYERCNFLYYLVYAAGMANTGSGTAGTRDANWKMISAPSGTAGFTTGSYVYTMTAASGWTSSTSSAKWIGVPADGNTGVPPGQYVFQLSFASASYYSTSIIVYFMVDDALTSVTVSDGTSTIQTITTFSGNSWLCLNNFALTAFGQTTTTLTFTVQNGDVNNNPSGLLVQFGQFQYIANCPTPEPTRKFNSSIMQIIIVLTYN